MADEIQDQNVIKVWRDDASGWWHARIGPSDGRGVERSGHNPIELLTRLMHVIFRDGWIFDPTWKPR